MFPEPTTLEPPSDDKRWRIVKATMRRHGYARDALIETLHTVQESFGYLDETSLDYVAQSLRVPMSQVYGVSTFYHLFSLKPAGKHTCVLCTGTACYIKGIPKMLEAIETEFDVKDGETTPDDLLSLMTARCLGACGIAPVAVCDGEVMGKATTEKLLDRLQGWRDEDGA